MLAAFPIYINTILRGSFMPESQLFPVRGRLFSLKSMQYRNSNSTVFTEYGYLFYKGNVEHQKLIASLLIPMR